MERPARSTGLTNEVERLLLHFLCNGSRAAPLLREEILTRLRCYAFRRVEHQVLFDCLQAMPIDRTELVRELLPARLVRAGFPDFDLAPFLEPSNRSRQEAENLLEALTAAVSSSETGD